MVVVQHGWCGHGIGDRLRVSSIDDGVLDMIDVHELGTNAGSAQSVRSGLDVVDEHELGAGAGSAQSERSMRACSTGSGVSGVTCGCLCGGVVVIVSGSRRFEHVNRRLLISRSCCICCARR